MIMIMNIIYIYIYTWLYIIYANKKCHQTNVPQKHHGASNSINAIPPKGPFEASIFPGGAVAQLLGVQSIRVLLCQDLHLLLQALPLTQRARSSKQSGWLHVNFVHGPTAVPAQLLCAFLHLRASWSPKKSESHWDRNHKVQVMQLLTTKKNNLK